jgi:PTH1 family peptidyl-tRNA hydrolase
MRCWPFSKKPDAPAGGIKLIVGLGTPGPRYAQTRHNMGFRTAAILSRHMDIPLTRKGYGGVYGQGIYEGQKVLLLMPETYMNDSGRSVAQAARYFGTAPENILLIYDDIDLPVGRVRMRGQGGAGTHNGMRSVVEHLGTEAFPRVRIGVGQPPRKEMLVDWVLGIPSAEERTVLDPALDRAADAAAAWLTQGLETAMARANAAP